MRDCKSEIRNSKPGGLPSIRSNRCASPTYAKASAGRPVRQAQDRLLGKHNINCGMRIAECRIVRRNSRRSLGTEIYNPILWGRHELLESLGQSVKISRRRKVRRNGIELGFDFRSLPNEMKCQCQCQCKLTYRIDLKEDVSRKALAFLPGRMPVVA
jgi:hypothetical protein